MTRRSQLYELIEARLDTTLLDYVARHRATMSWRAMAADLHARTGIRVSYQTLRLWFQDRVTVTVIKQVEVAA